MKWRTAAKCPCPVYLHQQVQVQRLSYSASAPAHLCAAHSARPAGHGLSHGPRRGRTGRRSGETPRPSFRVFSRGPCRMFARARARVRVSMAGGRGAWLWRAPPLLLLFSACGGQGGGGGGGLSVRVVDVRVFGLQAHERANNAPFCCSDGCAAGGVSRMLLCAGAAAEKRRPAPVYYR